MMTGGQSQSIAKTLDVAKQNTFYGDGGQNLVGDPGIPDSMIIQHVALQFSYKFLADQDPLYTGFYLGCLFSFKNPGMKACLGTPVFTTS